MIGKLRRPRYGSAVIPNTAQAVDLVLCFCGNADMYSSSIIYLPIELAKMYFLERRTFTADCFVAQPTVMRCTHRREDNAAARKKFLRASIRENHLNC